MSALQPRNPTNQYAATKQSSTMKPGNNDTPIRPKKGRPTEIKVRLIAAIRSHLALERNRRISISGVLKAAFQQR